MMMLRTLGKLKTGMGGDTKMKGQRWRRVGMKKGWWKCQWPSAMTMMIPSPMVSHQQLKLWFRLDPQRYHHVEKYLGTRISTQGQGREAILLGVQTLSNRSAG